MAALLPVLGESRCVRASTSKAYFGSSATTATG
jgi:hypothetical protein